MEDFIREYASLSEQKKEIEKAQAYLRDIIMREMGEEKSLKHELGTFSVTETKKLTFTGKAKEELDKLELAAGEVKAKAVDSGEVEVSVAKSLRFLPSKQ